MDDEFLAYLKLKLGDRLIISFDYIDLLIWGARTAKDVELLGVTLTVGVDSINNFSKNQTLIQSKINSIAAIGQSIAKCANSTFFIVFYSLSEEANFLVTKPNDPLNINGVQIIKEDDMPRVIEDFFKTNFKKIGTAKAVNKTTSDWFHIWTRANLPTDYVKANIDGLVLSKQGEPVALLETKRSFYEPKVWKPYQADSRNYFLQHYLSKLANIAFWTIYHKKYEQVDDLTDVSVFKVADVFIDQENWIKSERLNITAITVTDLLNKLEKK